MRAGAHLLVTVADTHREKRWRCTDSGSRA